MTLSILILSFLLLLFNFLILYALNKKEKHTPEKAKEKFTDFSILIAAKNEEGNLGALLESLNKLSYPAEHFEIIFIDDNSTDNTPNLLNRFAQTKENVKVFSAERKNLPGKKGALQIGFAQAKFDVIVTTDADCEVPPQWLAKLNQKFLSGCDLVIGNSLYREEKRRISRYSAFELMRNRILIFAFAKLGLPYSAAGSNFAFRKKVLEKIGGYENISQVLSGDDDLLLQSAKREKFKIGVLFEKGATVKTKAPESFAQLLRQKSRHVSTSNYYSLGSKIFLAFWHLLNIVGIAFLFYAPWKPIFLIVPIVKLALDYVVIRSQQKKFSYKFNLVEILAFQFFYEFLLPVYYLKGTFGKTEWKS